MIPGIVAVGLIVAALCAFTYKPPVEKRPAPPPMIEVPPPQYTGVMWLVSLGMLVLLAMFMAQR